MFEPLPSRQSCKTLMQVRFSRTWKPAVKICPKHTVPADPQEGALNVIATWPVDDSCWLFQEMCGQVFGRAAAVINFRRVQGLLVALIRRWLLALCSMYYDDASLQATTMALWNFMVQLFNQKMRASPWKKCSFKGFVKKTPEKRTFIPQLRFSCFLLIICDNWIFYNFL